jgi:hypothetical protein
MKIAIFSDVHSNLPALEAVLTDSSFSSNYVLCYQSAATPST